MGNVMEYEDMKACNCSQCGKELVVGRDEYYRIHDRPWCKLCCIQKTREGISYPNTRVEVAEQTYHGGRFYSGEW